LPDTTQRSARLRDRRIEEIGVSLADTRAVAMAMVEARRDGAVSEAPALPDSDRNLADGPLAEAIFRKLLAQIYNGRLAAGTELKEAVLAEEFGVSRGPVREAIRRLQGFQLVTREPYQRARVVELTPDFVRQLFEVRMALEGMACNLAAQRMTDEELRQIGEELESARMRALTPESSTREPEKAFDFHERIVRGCGNERIIEMLCGDMYHLLRIYRRRSGALPERRGQPSQEHWQILRALQARDGALAESLMRAHIGRANELLLAAQTAAAGAT
jgi:DNA-binding GntR family transcriptional regulator